MVVARLLICSSGVNHGTFLHIAHEEGLIKNSSVHAGIRAPVSNPKYDIKHDKACGFNILTARDLDKMGTQGIIDKLKDRVAGSKVYISVDIDVLDPSFAPATGTAEVGGWTTRELLTILDGLEGIELIGADVGKLKACCNFRSHSKADVILQSRSLQYTTILARQPSWLRQR